MCAHVVLAEDDPKQAELVRRYLEREQHTVVVVHDGRATSTSQAPPAAERPRFRMDMTDQEKQDLYRVYLKCMQDHGVNVMADRDGSAQTDKVTAEKAQKACDSKLSLPAWEEDATNPEAMDFAKKVVDCLRAKGVKKVDVSTNDGIVGPGARRPGERPGVHHQGMDLIPVCQREVFKQK